ncbi:hypothetical protein FQZ97_914070 [compost metagenome]
MCNAEALARQTVEEIAGDGFARRKADAVHEAVKLGPCPCQIGEHPVDLRVLAHVAIENQPGVKFGRELGDAVLETFTHVAECELGTLRVAGFGNPVSDRAVGQHTGDQQFLASEKTHCSASRENSSRIVACAFSTPVSVHAGSPCGRLPWRWRSVRACGRHTAMPCGVS